jgi:RNA polymerase sigma factor (sigma-70 family)
MNDETDEELMRSYQIGKQQAFETLYVRYSGKVYGFLKRRVHDAALVDDIHQASFLKLHESRAQYKSEFKFAPWLFVITRTVMIDQLRKLKNRSPERQAEEFENIAAESNHQPAAFDLLDLLPESQSAVLEMRYARELEFSEMAKELNTTASNARKQVSRAIRNLKARIKK